MKRWRGSAGCRRGGGAKATICCFAGSCTACGFFKRAGGEDKVHDLLLREILHRLRFLQEVGLGYLTLDRPAPTLSGGEVQRARLATHLGSGLVGVCYILDEPTIGLHVRDTDRLIAAL